MTDPDIQESSTQNFKISVQCSWLFNDCDFAFIKIERSAETTKAELVKHYMSTPRSKTIETIHGDTICFHGLHTKRRWKIDVTHGNAIFKKINSEKEEFLNILRKGNDSESYIAEVADGENLIILPISHLQIRAEINA
jgi:hypothetical protein